MDILLRRIGIGGDHNPIGCGGRFRDIDQGTEIWRLKRNLRVEIDGLSVQQRTADVLQLLQVLNAEIVLFCHFVEREHALHIRCCGNDRLRLNGSGNALGQVVCTAQMAGEQTDGKCAVLV